MNNPASKHFSLPILILFSLMVVVGIASCGGGGGGSKKPSITIDSPMAVEGDAGTVELMFTITLSEGAEETLTMDYTTSDDTATEADNDFVAVNGQITIPEGSRTANVSVFANGDGEFEQDESFNLVVSNAQGISLSESSYSGSGLIENDDDADPKGYFTGSATVDGTNYTDVTALVYANRVLIFSPTANVLYDIALSTTVFDYTGTVEVYVDGNIEQVGAVTISGTTNELQIEGTFAGGTGFGAGSFDVAFDADNNRGATLGRIEAEGVNNWEGNLYGIDVDTGEFHSDDAGNYFGIDDNDNNCVFPDPIANPSTLAIPDQDSNIYQLSHDIDSQGGGTCAITYESTGHTGFASVVDDTSTDDKLIFAFTNGAIAMFGIMNK